MRMKKLSIAPKIVSRKGSGRIDDNIPVDFMEYAIPKPDDAADALAVAVCHAHSGGMNDKLGLNKL